MSPYGHQENWGVSSITQTVTIAICNRCARPYGFTCGPIVLCKGDTLLVHFPCCPDAGGQYIEWNVEELVNA